MGPGKTIAREIVYRDQGTRRWASPDVRGCRTGQGSKQKRRGVAPASIRWIRESYLLAGVGTGLVVVLSVVFLVVVEAPVVDFFFLVDDFFLWVVVPVVEWVVVSVVAFE